ncbi:hypothetical protein N7533_006614 [Penicillium manginii]|uniref:uncharacterized protein n=1 Tax=Penicillium manginii TaxID=203109 RepID=UPI002548B75A|nr:uncharacterized protein N7533_006614 [Penicillium manginii]KAJ5749586.1 hypothetical protein N7533_006614 [Penicillium manginii]
MRAKRSKKYRKLMHQYEMTFGFREPYQVLVDSNFVHAIDQFKMELLPALERTLQGKPKPSNTTYSADQMFPGRNPGRTAHKPQDQSAIPSAPSPPPTELPLRHCSHNPESSPIDEVDCLLSLLSPNAEVKKNKEHYILATADAPVKKVDKNDAQRKRKRDEEREEERALRRSQMLRLRARQIPGVPIIYVKRSVMVLEPLSTRSETVRDGAEKAKFRYGLDDPSLEKAEEEETKKKRGPKVKAPNPLSVKKSKKKETGPAKEKSQKKVVEDDDVPEKEDGDDAGAAKPKRRRRHHKSGAAFSNDNDDAAPLAETGPESGAMEVDE